MNNLLDVKLNRLCGIDVVHGDSLKIGAPKHFAKHDEILSHGAAVTLATLLLNGMAFRYRLMPDGRRAILGFLVPGDFLIPIFPLPQKLDYAVATLTHCEAADVPLASIFDVTTSNPRVAYALASCAELDATIQRDWLATIGQCNAEKRIARLFCELRQRLELVGLADREGFNFPMTQQDLADAMGLSVVHANRVMQNLRRQKLIRTFGEKIYFPNLDELERLADFTRYECFGDRRTASSSEDFPQHDISASPPRSQQIGH